MKKKITIKTIKKFEHYLVTEEKSKATIEKYIRDVHAFFESLSLDKTITKEETVAYKQKLSENYQPSSMNSMLVSLNRFLDFIKMPECKVKLNKIQKRTFGDENKELTKEEYKRLLQAAKLKKNDQLYVLLQTICATGIRVSEHKYITVEAIEKGKATIINKGKVREIIIPIELKKMLLQYSRRNNIKKGSVFITRNGKPLDRSNIWTSMKALCKEAKVDSTKVFPHNLRHLFAITYYRLEKDLDTLASLLGHSSINTTRIYTMKSGRNCLRTMSKMNLCLRI
ncbi:MAG: tyrosine-type recombinase/integrase [Longibaculum sp.]